MDWSEVFQYDETSVGRYGEDEAKRLAIEYRENKIKELNKNGAGYTERHGDTA